MPRSRPKTWTTRDLLAWMTSAFEGKGLDAPRRMGEMLMAHVIGTERLRLYMDPDRPATPLELDRLRDLVRRALEYEPIQYLVGEESFFGMTIKVDRRVLIPRPSTQTIVEEVLHHARSSLGARGRRGPDAGGGVLIADVCTGSGCVAAALAKNLGGVRVVASDLSEDALACARENLERHALLDRVELVRGDLLAPIDAHPAAGRPGALRYLVSNPPYIPDHEWDAVAPNVKDHEPTLALRAGAEGMDCIRPIIEHAPVLLAPGGLLCVECASSHAPAVLGLARAHALIERASIVKDSDGLDRVLVAQRAED